MGIGMVAIRVWGILRRDIRSFCKHCFMMTFKVSSELDLESAATMIPKRTSESATARLEMYEDDAVWTLFASLFLFLFMLFSKQCHGGEW